MLGHGPIRQPKFGLGLREGSTEATRVAPVLLLRLVERGLNAGRFRLWVIGAGKALRNASAQTFSQSALIRRYQHKRRRDGQVMLRRVASALSDEAKRMRGCSQM